MQPWNLPTNESNSFPMHGKPTLIHFTPLPLTSSAGNTVEISSLKRLGQTGKEKNERVCPTLAFSRAWQFVMPPGLRLMAV